MLIVVSGMETTDVLPPGTGEMNTRTRALDTHDSMTSEWQEDRTTCPS